VLTVQCGRGHDRKGGELTGLGVGEHIVGGNQSAVSARRVQAFRERQADRPLPAAGAYAGFRGLLPGSAIDRPGEPGTGDAVEDGRDVRRSRSGVPRPVRAPDESGTQDGTGTFPFGEAQMVLRPESPPRAVALRICPVSRHETEAPSTSGLSTLTMRAGR
jgi:hypothetical protein